MMQSISKLANQLGFLFFLLIKICILQITFFIFILFYIINAGKNGENEAIKNFNNTGSKQIILKNELLNEWLETKKLEIHYPVNAKILLCGSNKCLVAIPNINIKNPQYSSIPTLNNYLIMTIDTGNYIILK